MNSSRKPGRWSSLAVLSRGTRLLGVAALLAAPGCATPPRDNNNKISSDTRLQIADLAAQGGDTESARSIVAAAALRDPGNAELQLRYATALADSGEATHAVSITLRAMAASPHNIDLAVKCGQLQLRVGDARTAAQTFQTLVQHGNGGTAALNGLGVARAQLHEMGGAEEAFRRAAAANPRDLISRNNLAMVLVLQGRATEAVPLLQSLADEPDVPDRVRHNLALAYAQSGNQGQAASVLTGLEGNAAASAEVAGLSEPAPEGMATRLGPVQFMGDTATRTVAALAPPKPAASAPAAAPAAVVPQAQPQPQVQPQPQPVAANTPAPAATPPIAAAAPPPPSSTLAASRTNAALQARWFGHRDQDTKIAAPVQMAQATPVQPAPVQPAPVQPAPVQPAAVQPAPVQRAAAAPAQPAPAPATPVRAAPVPATPTQPAAAPTAPGQPLRVQAAALQTAEVQPPPAHPAPAQPVAAAAALPAPVQLAPTQAAAPVAPAPSAVRPATLPAGGVGSATPARVAVLDVPSNAADSAGDGGIRVNIAAAPSKAVALAMWQELIGEVPDLLSGRTPEVSQLGGGPTPWRLGTGGFDSVSSAQRFCQALRGRGRNCTVDL